MSQLSNTLQLLFKSRPGLSQRVVAIETGISEPQISRYVSGANEPNPEMLSRICSVLPEPERADIAAAYLQDHLPACARDLVAVVIRTSAGAPVPNEARARMNKKLRDGFGHLERLAVEDQAAADSLLAAIRFLRDEPTPLVTELTQNRIHRVPAAPRSSTNTSPLLS